MKIHLTIIFFLNISILFAQQNLVLNPSFEDTISCPGGLTQIYLSKNWFQPNTVYSSSDYFNACSNNAGVPNNGLGFQYAKTGNAYAGIVLISPNYQVDRREYIETSFLAPLQSNKKYFVSFYVVLANMTYYAVDRIGAFISNDSTLNSSLTVINVQPQIENQSNNIIIDTLNWVLVSGEYTAIGGENYITIGNFYNDLNTNREIVGNIAGDWAYYYIDDVSVILDTISGINEETNKETKFNFSPNPVIDNVTFNYFLPCQSVCEIFDLFGVKRIIILLEKGSSTKTVNLEGLNNGVYFYNVRDEKGNKIKTGKLMIQK